MQRILQLFSRALRLSLVVGLLCCTAATARAQGGGEPINLNATLTVTLTERPATAVLDEITRKTGIKFAYDPEDIRRLPAVSGEFKKVTVHELLDKCIAGSTFKYAIENNVVLVYDSTVKMRKFTVSGTVRDAGKTVLPGASVILKARDRASRPMKRASSPSPSRPRPALRSSKSGSWVWRPSR